MPDDQGRRRPPAPPGFSGETIAPMPVDAPSPAQGTLTPEDLPSDPLPKQPAAPPPRPESVPTPRRASAPPRASAAAPLRPGAQLGRWILDRELGTGTTATVWAAHHEHLDAPVAIKVFHRKGMAFQAILGEAQAASGIPSPHVVWVHDVDLLDGHPCIVMELVGSLEHPAQSLREVVPQSSAEAARWIADAARGVEAAHQVGVFHKDIKPPNILLGPLDQRARISDFGLANPLLFAHSHATGRRAQETIALSVEDVRSRMMNSLDDPCAAIRGTMRLGTPEFMAPEQAAGLRRDLNPQDPVHRFHLQAIDVYGLGATLWCLLTGHPPYPRDGQPPEQVSAEAIMDEVVDHPPPSLRRAAPGVPRGLARIVERAMDRDPRRRHPSAAALADDLEAWLAQRPTSLDDTPWRRALVHVRRERATVRLMLLLALVTAGSSAMVWYNVQRIEEQQAMVASLHAQVEAERAALAAERSERGAVEEDLASASAALEEKARTLQASRRRLSSASAELEALRARQSEATESLTSVKALLANTEAVLEETRQTLRDVEQARDAALFRVGVLESEAASLRDDLEAEERATADLRAELSRLRVQYRELERQDEDLAARVSTLTQDLRRARQQAGYYREENTRLRSLLDRGTDRPPPPSP